MYTPTAHAYMPAVMLSSYSTDSGRMLTGLVSTPASAVWSTTNRMIYVPFALERAVTVYKFWWLNGATVGTNNLRAAVYDGSFNRLILGNSTLSAGANVCQYDDITDTALGPGRYYMCLWCNGVTATVFSNAAGAKAGIYYETHASGPQATGTPVSPGTMFPAQPLFGLQLRSSP